MIMISANEKGTQARGQGPGPPPQRLGLAGLCHGVLLRGPRPARRGVRRLRTRGGLCAGHHNMAERGARACKSRLAPVARAVLRGLRLPGRPPRPAACGLQLRPVT
eukprot:tig00020603_g11821.t1